MTKISDTAQLILHGAANHEHGLASGLLKLPTAARNAVFKSLLKQNMLTEINAPKEYVGLGWRQDDAGVWVALRITDEGFRAIGIDPNERQAGEMGEPDASGIEGSVPDGCETWPEGCATHRDPALQDEEDAALEANMKRVASAAPTMQTQPAPLAEEIALLDETLARPRTTAPTKQTLRFAAARVIDAWDAGSISTTDTALDEAIRALRDMLDAPADEPATRRVKPTGQRALRETKHAQVLALLARDEGATGAQIAEATGWANNTVRGFLAGLKSKGHQVEVIDRVRQVGPNKTGAKGSYTVYRIAKEG